MVKSIIQKPIVRNFAMAALFTAATVPMAKANAMSRADNQNDSIKTELYADADAYNDYIADSSRILIRPEYDDSVYSHRLRMYLPIVNDSTPVRQGPEAPFIRRQMIESVRKYVDKGVGRNHHLSKLPIDMIVPVLKAEYDTAVPVQNQMITIVDKIIAQIENIGFDSKDDIKKLTNKYRMAKMEEIYSELEAYSEISPRKLDRLRDLMDEAYESDCKFQSDVDDVEDYMMHFTPYHLGPVLPPLEEELLSLLVKAAENTQINKEYNQILDVYSEVLDSTEVTPGHITTYKIATDKKLKERGLNSSYRKPNEEAYKMFKLALEEASYNQLLDEIKTTNANPKTYLGFVDVIKGKHKALEYETGVRDKVYRSYVNKHEEIVRTGKNHNRVMARSEEIKHVTYDDLVKGLGSELAYKFYSLYLKDHVNADGTYDFSLISKAILYRAGYNYCINNSTDPEMAEIQNIIVDLERTLPNKTIAEGEAKKVARFCGYPTENWERGGFLKDMFLGAIAAGGTTWRYHSIQTVSIVCSESESVEIITNLAKQGITNSPVQKLSSGQFVIKVIQDAFFDPTLISTLGGIAVGVIFDLIGEPQKFERSCYNPADWDPQNMMYNDESQIKEYINARYEEGMARFLIGVLESTRRYDGKYDPEVFTSIMNRMGGVGSPVSCNKTAGSEPIGAKMYMEIGNNKKPAPVKIKPVEVEGFIIENKDSVVDVIDETVEEVKKVLYEGKKVPTANVYWSDVSSWYDCFKTMPTRMQGIMVKILQCINDGNYTKENMDKIYKVADTALRQKGIGSTEAYLVDHRDEIGFDLETSRHLALLLITPSMPKEIRVPDNVYTIPDENGKQVGCDPEIPDLTKLANERAKMRQSLGTSNVAQAEVTEQDKMNMQRLNESNNDSITVNVKGTKRVEVVRETYSVSVKFIMSNGEVKEQTFTGSSIKEAKRKAENYQKKQLEEYKRQNPDLTDEQIKNLFKVTVLENRSEYDQAGEK